MNRALTVIACMVASLPLASCKMLRGDCHKPGPYAAAETRPPLRIPPGLEAPDTRAAVKIPELNEPERPRTASDPCLDTPPSYKTPRESQPRA